MDGDAIDHDGPVPVYEQIATILRRQIKAGDLQPGRAIPSEATLVQRYGVARDTARRAVEVLREEGLVVTVKGKGSYVNPQA